MRGSSASPLLRKTPRMRRRRLESFSASEPPRPRASSDGELEEAPAALPRRTPPSTVGAAHGPPAGDVSEECRQTTEETASASAEQITPTRVTEAIRRKVKCWTNSMFETDSDSDITPPAGAVSASPSPSACAPQSTGNSSIKVQTTMRSLRHLTPGLGDCSEKGALSWSSPTGQVRTDEALPTAVLQFEDETDSKISSQYPLSPSIPAKSPLSQLHMVDDGENKENSSPAARPASDKQAGLKERTARSASPLQEIYQQGSNSKPPRARSVGSQPSHTIVLSRHQPSAASLQSVTPVKVKPPLGYCANHELPMSPSFSFDTVGESHMSTSNANSSAQKSPSVTSQASLRGPPSPALPSCTQFIPLSLRTKSVEVLDRAASASSVSQSCTSSGSKMSAYSEEVESLGARLPSTSRDSGSATSGSKTSSRRQGSMSPSGATPYLAPPPIVVDQRDTNMEASSSFRPWFAGPSFNVAPEDCSGHFSSIDLDLTDCQGPLSDLLEAAFSDENLRYEDSKVDFRLRKGLEGPSMTNHSPASRGESTSFDPMHMENEVPADAWGKQASGSLNSAGLSKIPKPPPGLHINFDIFQGDVENLITSIQSIDQESHSIVKGPTHIMEAGLDEACNSEGVPKSLTYDVHQILQSICPDSSDCVDNKESPITCRQFTAHSIASPNETDISTASVQEDCCSDDSSDLHELAELLKPYSEDCAKTQLSDCEPGTIPADLDDQFEAAQQCDSVVYHAIENHKSLSAPQFSKPRKALCMIFVSLLMVAAAVLLSSSSWLLDFVVLHADRRMEVGRPSSLESQLKAIEELLDHQHSFELLKHASSEPFVLDMYRELQAIQKIGVDLMLAAELQIDLPHEFCYPQSLWRLDECSDDGFEPLTRHSSPVTDEPDFPAVHLDGICVPPGPGWAVLQYPVSTFADVVVEASQQTNETGQDSDFCLVPSLDSLILGQSNLLDYSTANIIPKRPERTASSVTDPQIPGGSDYDGAGGIDSTPAGVWHQLMQELDGLVVAGKDLNEEQPLWIANTNTSEHETVSTSVLQKLTRNFTPWALKLTAAAMLSQLTSRFAVSRISERHIRLCRTRAEL